MCYPMNVPKHLNTRQIVNFGSFYTKKTYVDIVWEYIAPYIDERTVILDPACGYGAFLARKTQAVKIGNDIDPKALHVARQIAPETIYYNYNALTTFTRKAYGIKEKQKLIIIGNPPYNDLTSHAKKRMKKLKYDVSPLLNTRDTGISFLRMFSYLKPDYIAVLHPLSYLIKKTNFNLLKNFKENYKLIHGLVISSKDFNFTSKVSQFPILITLYKQVETGMSYDFIQNFLFQTLEGKQFRLKDFQFIGNLIDKYPKKNYDHDNTELLFYTLRDINALKRNKTFLEKPIKNALRIDPAKLDYYLYVDIFKEFIRHIPYYLGNLDIIINTELFEQYKKYFISHSLKKRPSLKKYYPNFPHEAQDLKFIEEYFRELLGNHYVE